jgi:hypothetical protein
MAVTRYRAVSNGHSGAQFAAVRIPPWTSRSGGPSPSVIVPIATPSLLRTASRMAWTLLGRAHPPHVHLDAIIVAL